VQLYLPQRNRSFGSADAIGVIGLFGLLIARFIPVARLVPFWGCTFRRVTGIPCPGCGLTRVADRFAHLHLLGALEANPLGTVAAAFFAVMVVLTVLHLVFKVPIPEVVMNEREWKGVRYVAIGLFCMNYAWVVFAHTQLHFH
jgi:hypothetical protein